MHLFLLLGSYLWHGKDAIIVFVVVVCLRRHFWYNISTRDTVKFLGVHFDQNFTLGQHTHKACSIVRRTLNIIKFLGGTLNNITLAETKLLHVRVKY